MQPEVFYSLLQRAHRDFPGAFPKPALPLAFAVREALAAAWPDTSKSSVIKFLKCYHGSPSYLKAIAAGGPRYKLDGAMDGEVSGADQANAIERLAALKQRKEASRRELAKAA